MLLAWEYSYYQNIFQLAEEDAGIRDIYILLIIVPSTADAMKEY